MNKDRIWTLVSRKLSGEATASELAEIDELIKFFQTSAGKKMDKEFLLLLVQSVKDGEQLLKLAVKDLEKDK